MFCFFVDYYFCHPLNYDVRLAVQGKKKKKHTQQDFAHREGSPTEPRLYWGAIKGTLSGESRMKCQVQVCGKRERRHLTTKEGKRCFVESEKWLLWGDEESKKKKKKKKETAKTCKLQTDLTFFLAHLPTRTHSPLPASHGRLFSLPPSFCVWNYKGPSVRRSRCAVGAAGCCCCCWW